MTTKATQRRLARMDDVLAYLRQRPDAPTAGELAHALDLHPTTCASYIDALVRTGQVTTWRGKRDQWVVKYVGLRDWTPDRGK